MLKVGGAGLQWRVHSCLHRVDKNSVMSNGWNVIAASFPNIFDVVVRTRPLRTVKAMEASRSNTRIKSRGRQISFMLWAC